MTDHHRDLLWVASRLLSYPSDELLRVSLDRDPSAYEVPPAHRAPLERFLGHARSTDLLELQQDYVRTFDLSDRTPLHMTYSQLRDGRDRGTALAALKARYRAAGLDPPDRELPDFLPLLLEFMAMAPDPAVREVAEEFAPTVARLAANLRAIGSPYADVVTPVAAAFRALASNPASRWWGR